jgi:glutamine amidotransferase
MLALVDYGVGNLHSVAKALAAVGAQVELTSEPSTILQADKVVLPGVGAFGDGMAGLNQRNLTPVIRQVAGNGTPLLGICLGMQLLFGKSEESGTTTGIGLIPGEVVAFRGEGLKIPQIGWNQIYPTGDSLLLKGIVPGQYVYFNHGYYCSPQDQDAILGTTNYGVRFASVVGSGNILGVQFHPEKSQDVGLRILKNFVEGA